jgi:hypothetical protein
MKRQTLMFKIRDLFRREPETNLPDPLVEGLIRSLTVTHEHECDCGEFHEMIDQYAESNIRGEDAARLMPLVKDHLEICNECCEEYEALLKVLESAVNEK